MILAQYNILKLYEVKASRQWDNTANREISIVFLETNHIPAIQLISDIGTSATIQLMDSSDTAVGSPLNMVVTDVTTYKRLSYIGTTLTGQSDGYYYLKITNGVDIYYTDVFAWITDTSELLKISATSSNISVGGYVFDLTSFTYLCYLNAEYKGVVPNVEEDADEDDGVTSPYYSSLAKTRIWIIDGNEYIYEFLLGLRLLDLNGSVTITWNSVAYAADDILIEIETDHGGADLLDIELRIIPGNGIIKVINTIN